MRVLRIQVDEMAAPTLALERDGAIYDIATLEEIWGWGGWTESCDFHTRVFSMRCAGLREVDARLASGDRPTASRLWPQDLLPLPPCDTDRVSYVQLAPRWLERSEPGWEQRDARALVGTNQPVPVPGGSLAVEVGVAALVGEEMERVGPREARRGIAGFALYADWTSKPQRWEQPDLVGDAPSQLGPGLTVGLTTAQLAGLRATIEAGDRTEAVSVGGWRFAPEEAIAYLSRSHPLRPGDVVGLGALAAPAISWGERLSITVPRLGTLQGWAVASPEAPPWRLSP